MLYPFANSQPSFSRKAVATVSGGLRSQCLRTHNHPSAERRLRPYRRSLCYSLGFSQPSFSRKAVATS